ncbi:MAG: SurA N-terminal domain-containing protein [Acidobacteriota bacterium]|nr:SurA N-terminal domain-containing protein [Acidobacteriota bacterium]
MRVAFKVLFLFAFPLFAFPPALAQAVVTDKMVATVNSGGVRPSLITYSDLLWQLALEPDAPLENPSSELLNRTLNLVISQRLVLQEAEKLPAIEPTSKEIDDRRNEFVRQFPSQAEFMQRVSRVGLSSDRLREIVRQRLTIEKYIDFRFRSFTVVTQKEVEDYYRDVWVPRFRRQRPGQLVPELKDVYNKVESELTESKIESDTDEFIDSARDRAEITILNPV